MRMFQPVMVRPGTATRLGLASAAASASWLASRSWDADDYRRWLFEGALISLRKPHLAEWGRAIDAGWAGGPSALAGPLMAVGSAPDWVMRAPVGGWRAWGTTPPRPSTTVVRVPTLDADDPTMVAVATRRVHNLIGYVGQPVAFEEFSRR